MRYTAVTLILLAALVMLSTGCGPMAPSKVKDNLYSARADAKVTGEELDAMAPPVDASAEDLAAFYQVKADKARKALTNIAGTKVGNYEDGLLTAPFHYFQGTRATPYTPTTQPSSQPAGSQ